MDLYKDKSNINLPQYFQSINFDKTKLKTIIVNTQKCVYDLKIAEINERIQRYVFQKNFIILNYVCTCMHLYIHLVFMFLFYFIFVCINKYV